MEEEDLPVKVIKEECLLFEEDNSDTLNEYSQYDNLLENIQPVKKEGPDTSTGPIADIIPKEEPDEKQVDNNKPKEEAGVNEPSSSIKPHPTEDHTSTKTAHSDKSYLGAEHETKFKEKDRTEKEQFQREGLRECTVLLQNVSKLQGVQTGSRNESGREIIASNNNISVPASDDFLHCQECCRKYEGDCPLHGPLIVVEDTPVPLNVNDKLRAKKSAPPQVSVAESSVLNAGGGVVAHEIIPARTRFGPYEGQVIPPRADAAHAWVVWKDGKHDHSLDASEPGLSNWMRFVNFARCDEEQNLAAFQFKGKIYFKTLREVAAGEELLVSDSGVVNAEVESASKGTFVMSAHLRTHSGDKPLSCKHGGKRFTQKENLLRHLRTHSGEE